MDIETQLRDDLRRVGAHEPVPLDAYHRFLRRHRRRARATAAAVGTGGLVLLGLGAVTVAALPRQDGSQPASGGTQAPAASPSVTPPRPEQRPEPPLRADERPAGPKVVVSQGVYEGTPWRYEVYRTAKGKVCGLWTIGRQAWDPPGTMEFDSPRCRRPGYHDFTSNGRPVPLDASEPGMQNAVESMAYGRYRRSGNRLAKPETPTAIDCPFPAEAVRVRIEVDGGQPLDLRLRGAAEGMGMNFLAFRPDDAKKLGTMTVYDERGVVLAVHDDLHWGVQPLRR
jgi:hypothetical protein